MEADHPVAEQLDVPDIVQEATLMPFCRNAIVAEGVPSDTTVKELAVHDIPASN